MSRFIDTNVFLRYIAQPITVDDQRRYLAAMALFQRITRSEETVVTTESVLVEILFVLCSPRQYGLDRAYAVDILRPIVELPALELSWKSMYLRALDYFRSDRRLDMEDAITVAFMERHGIDEIWSFDRDFDRIPGVTRLEPER